MFKLEYLWRGFPGHPLHPPLTDAAIGAYTAATALAIADVSGVLDKNGAVGWWLALLIGLLFTIPTALTGLADWLAITWGSPLWWTATLHMLTMITATAFFAVAAAIGHSSYTAGNVHAGPFVLTAVGWCVLVVGGWLGGTITFVHGMRVLNLVDEPTARAVLPAPLPEKEQAEA
jgi:uncharacterized membrane protein